MWRRPRGGARQGGRGRAESDFGRERGRTAVEVGELEVRSAGKDEVIFSKHVNTILMPNLLSVAPSDAY